MVCRDKEVDQLLLSPNFEYGTTVKTIEGNQWVICKNLKKDHYSKLISCREKGKKLKTFFSADSNSVGFTLKNGDYRICRSENGQVICDIPISYQDLSLSYGYGGFQVALTILDLASRKSMPFSIEACLHMCHGPIHLFENDLEDKKYHL